MALYRTASFEVRPEALIAAKRAISDFVMAVNAKEPATRLYLSLQNKEIPNRFVHVMAFDDEAAEARHRGTPWVKTFTDVLYPLTTEGVQFTSCGSIGAEAQPRGGKRAAAKKPAKKAKKARR